MATMGHAGATSVDERTTPTSEPVPPLVRATWIALAMLVPFLWGWTVLIAATSDGTATFPSTSWDQRRHWSITDGVPIVANYGAADLRAGDPGRGAADRVTAVGRPGEALVALADRAAAEARPAPRRGDEMIYRVTRTTGMTEEIVVRLGRYPFGALLTAQPWCVLLSIGLWMAGSSVFWRRARDPAARALLGLAVFVTGGMMAFPIGIQVVDLAGGRGVWPYVVSEVFNTLAWGTMLLFALVFPVPLDVVARHRGLLILPYVVVFGAYGVWAGWWLWHRSPGLERLEALIGVSAPASWVTLPTIVGVLLLAYREARSTEYRQALRIVTGGVFLAVVVYLLLGRIPDMILGAPIIPFRLLPLALLAPLLAIMAAVLRYRLFAIDVIVRRSLLILAVTVGVGALFLGLTTLASVIVDAVITDTAGSSRVRSLALVVFGGAVGAGLVPVAWLLRRWLGRLAFGAREDPVEIVTQLREFDITDRVGDVLKDVVETLTRALRLSYAAIELAGEAADASVTVVATGQPRHQPQIIRLASGGRDFGRLLLEVHPSREPFGPKDGRLLSEIGAQVGTLVQSVMANAQLRRSRERIVSTREEERRRLQRDLHDGLGPSLAAQSMQLEVARELIGSDPRAAEQLIAHLAEQAQADIAEVRRLVDDLRPRILDQLGLVTALRELAAGFSATRRQAIDGSHDGFTWEIHATDLGLLPAAVEVAAYRIAAEAGHNAARHSGAHHCRCTLRRGVDWLDLIVSDNGRGHSGQRAGVGLRSMRERAEEVGGWLTTSSEPGRGTEIRVRLPLRGEIDG